MILTDMKKPPTIVQDKTPRYVTKEKEKKEKCICVCVSTCGKKNLNLTPTTQPTSMSTPNTPTNVPVITTRSGFARHLRAQALAA